MRYLLIVILAAAAAWAGYWFIGSNRLTTELETWFEQRRAEGWQAEYASMTVRGFPNRFDTTFTDLALADPRTGVAWQAPFFQLMALSYKPHHIIAIWPNTHSLATPFDTFDISSEDMRASLVFQPQSDLRLNRSTVTAQQLVITSRAQNEFTRIETFSMAAELDPDSGLPQYHLGLRAADMSLSDGWLGILDPNGTLPHTLAGVSADLTVEFDDFWDVRAIEERRPQPQKIALRLAEARWGDLLLQAAGELTVDQNGLPSGEITIKAENWKQILELAKASGQIPEGVANMIENGLGLLARMSGNTKNLDVPLSFKSGQLRLGILPLGPAPRIYIR